MDAELPALGQLPEHDPKDGAWQAELVARCLRGDEQAFALIVNQYGDLLLRTAYLVVQDEETARDVVQETCLLAWKNLSQLREPEHLRAWLLRIAVNQSTTVKRQWARKAAWLRQESRQQQVEGTIQAADSERGLFEEMLDMRQAIGQLPVKQRLVLVLFYYHRMTVPEMAALLKTSENTLRKRLLAAREKIREALGAPLTPIQKQRALPNTLSTHAGYIGGQHDE